MMQQVNVTTIVNLGDTDSKLFRQLESKRKSAKKEFLEDEKQSKSG